MARRIRLENVTEADLADAQAIVAVDPTVPGYCRQLWMLVVAADVVRDGEAVTPRAAIDPLEVELDSADPDQYQRLKAMVEATKAPFLEGTWDFDK